MPIKQWLYFDSLECLSEEDDFMLTEEECAPVSILSKSCRIARHGCTNIGGKSVYFLSPRETAAMTVRLQCLGKTCRKHLPSSGTSW